MTHDINRITQMEQRLQRAARTIADLEAALSQFEGLHDDIEALDAYLGSCEWQADRAADQAGCLPESLHRGVLSEDAIWNLLERYRDIKEQWIEWDK